MPVVDAIFNWSDWIIEFFPRVIDIFQTPMKEIDGFGPILNALNNVLGAPLDWIFGTEFFGHIFELPLIEFLIGPALGTIILLHVVLFLLDFIN